MRNCMNSARMNRPGALHRWQRVMRDLQHARWRRNGLLPSTGAKIGAVRFGRPDAVTVS